VLRAYTTNRGFEIDRTFQCGPGILTGQAIGLVEKPSKGGGTGGILTVDTEGNAAICSPGLEPELTVLMSPPSITFSHLAAITQDLGDLYVLDPQSRAVWVYSNSDVTREPVNFFTDESPSMDGVIDLSVNNDELYLLHEDGHMTFCLSARMDVSPSRCPSPPPSFVDLRPGRENLLMQLDYPFSQILYATPPDPSLYFLEPFTQSVYHFSLRTLTFQRQILPKSSLKDELATAFFVNHIDRTIYLAIDNNVYYANIP
jgi:hypothetical protein